MEFEEEDKNDIIHERVHTMIVKIFRADKNDIKSFVLN